VLIVDEEGLRGACGGIMYGALSTPGELQPSVCDCRGCWVYGRIGKVIIMSTEYAYYEAEQG
jgi:hypothetical protein